MEDKTLVEIEEYLKETTNEETNLYMRCLECDEFKPICQMNIETELCDECNKRNDD